MKVNWFHCNPALFWLSFIEEIMNIAKIPAIAFVVAISAIFSTHSSQASTNNPPTGTPKHNSTALRGNLVVSCQR